MSHIFMFDVIFNSHYISPVSISLSVRHISHGGQARRAVPHAVAFDAPLSIAHVTLITTNKTDSTVARAQLNIQPCAVRTHKPAFHVRTNKHYKHVFAECSVPTDIPYLEPCACYSSHTTALPQRT